MEFLAKLISLITTGRRTNAFSVFVVFYAVSCIFILLFYKMTDDQELKKYLLFAFMGLMVFGALMYLGYSIFAKKYLQTDYFRIEDKRLDMIGQKGSNVVSNPAVLTTPKQLNEGGKDE